METGRGARINLRLTASLLALAALTSAACGGGTVATQAPTSSSQPSPATGSFGAGSPTAPTTTIAPPAAGVWPWEATSPEDHAHVLVGVEAGPEPTPDGQALGEGTAEASAPLESAVPAGSTSVDACALVSPDEWGAWTEREFGNASGQPPVDLEDGDACGWIAPGDRLRMAVAAFYAAGTSRWLDPAAADAGDPVEGLGDMAVWLAGWPLSVSSTLVIEAGPYDLVIEMSSLDGNQELMLEGARHFAAIALERLP